MFKPLVHVLLRAFVQRPPFWNIVLYQDAVSWRGRAIKKCIEMQVPFSWHNWPPTKTQEQTQLMQTWLHACSATVWLRNLRLDRANGRAWIVVSRQNIDIFIYVYTNSLWVHLRVSIHRHDVCPTYGKPVQKYIKYVVLFASVESYLQKSLS